MKILVVEDDRTVGQYVKRGLEEQRYQADLVDDGMEGLRLASGGRYDIIVLDLRLPGMNGFEMLRTLRDRGTTTPVLVLTAQDSVDFKVQALRAGADDYVTKPFAFEELLARVEALGRRPKEIRDPVLRVGDLELDNATREVHRGGERIDLTPKEYTVLEYLMRHAGRVMSRTLITEYAWDYHFDRAQRQRAELRQIRVQARVARALERVPRTQLRRARRPHRVRRLQHRADRGRRRTTRGMGRQRAVPTGGARGVSAVDRARPRRLCAQAQPATGAVLVVGLPDARLPEEQRAAYRSHLGERADRGALHRRVRRS
jgi:two-component system copper resistance phosphate regulon response regulator CusR